MCVCVCVCVVVVVVVRTFYLTFYPKKRPVLPLSTYPLKARLYSWGLRRAPIGEDNHCWGLGWQAGGVVSDVRRLLGHHLPEQGERDRFAGLL